VSRIPAKEIERNRDELGDDIPDSAGKVGLKRNDPTAKITSALPRRMSSHSSDAAFRVVPGGAT
jgi:hypothetical protein